MPSETIGFQPGEPLYRNSDDAGQSHVAFAEHLQALDDTRIHLGLDQ